MKRKYKLSLLVCMLSWTCNSLLAQDYIKDMNNVQNFLKTGEHSFHIRYLYYPFDSVPQVTDSLKGYVFVDGSQYYYKINVNGSIYEYIKNDKYYFVVDHGDKVIALRSSSEAKPMVWDIKIADSILHSGTVQTSFKDLGNFQEEYTISTEEGTWNKIKIVFSKPDYMTNQVWLCSSTKGILAGQPYDRPVIRIYYSDYGKEADKALLSEKRYFNCSQDKVILSEAYKGYELLDYIHIENKG